MAKADLFRKMVQLGMSKDCVLLIQQVIGLSLEQACVRVLQYCLNLLYLRMDCFDDDESQNEAAALRHGDDCYEFAAGAVVVVAAS